MRPHAASSTGVGSIGQWSSSSGRSSATVTDVINCIDSASADVNVTRRSESSSIRSVRQ